MSKNTKSKGGTAAAASDSGEAAVNVKQLFTELYKCERSRDYERGLKAANRILKTLPNDEDALLCKIISLVQLSKFEEVLDLLQKTPSLSEKAVFEKAYCEYRLNRTDEALNTLQKYPAVEFDLRRQELLAQLLYRKEDYDQCYKVYLELVKHSHDEYEEERQNNIAAVIAQLSTAEKHVAPAALSMDTYEQYYNEACRLLNRKDYAGAKQQLLKAAELCRETLLEEGATEDEIEEELAMIRTQEAYVEQMCGNTELALKMYTDVTKLRPSDVAVATVASNNIVSLKKEQNLFESRKRMKVCQSSQNEHKLPSKQLSIVCLNNALLQLYGNQFDMCRRSIAELKERFHNLEDACLIEAALLCRERQPQKALDLLSKLIKTSGSDKWVSSLALTQLQISEGKLRQATETLMAIDRLKWSLAAISLCVAISIALEDRQMAIGLLNDAIAWHRSHDMNSETVNTLMEHLASLLLSMQDFRVAAQYLEEIRKVKPNDATVLSRLIKAYSQFDANKAAAISKKLAEVESIAAESVDVASLENSNWLALGTKYGTKRAGKAEMTPKPGSGYKKKLRKRKKRLPKNYDPNVPPDPERWLPRFERSTFRKKKDKRQRDRDIGRGTQGAAGGGMELDSSKPDAATPTSPKHGNTISSPTAGPRQNKPIQAAKTKKKPAKKGNKW